MGASLFQSIFSFMLVHILCRWYEQSSNIPVGQVAIPHLIEADDPNTALPQLTVVNRAIPIIWPWDILSWRDKIDRLGCWIADKGERASMKCLVPLRKPFEIYFHFTQNRFFWDDSFDIYIFFYVHFAHARRTTGTT